MITTFVLGGYSLTSSFIFCKYLQRFLQDSTTANSDRASWIVLILASLLWPISLPLSALERNVQKTKSSFHYSDTQVNLIYIQPESKPASTIKPHPAQKEKIEV